MKIHSITSSGVLRRGLTVLTGVLLCSVLLLGPPASRANGSSTLAINWVVNAKTHLKSLNQTVVIPKGTFKGAVNLANDHFSGRLNLPKATSTIKLLGAVPIEATFEMKEVKPVSGTFTLKTLHVTSKASVNIFVTSATIAGIPYNAVGTTCQTSKPINIGLSGTVHLTGTSTFKGTYAIPALSNCGVATLLLNEFIEGPGNTFTASFAP